MNHQYQSHKLDEKKFLKAFPIIWRNSQEIDQSCKLDAKLFQHFQAFGRIHRKMNHPHDHPLIRCKKAIDFIDKVYKTILSQTANFFSSCKEMKTV
jgi:hypothetical protein